MAPYTWSLSSGALPDGIHLGGDGVLNGTPTESGSFSFSVRVADPVHAASIKDFVLTIQPAPLGIDTAPLPVGRVHVPYQSTLHASGGTPPYTWTLYAGPRHLGKLPTGFELSGGGVVSGQPTEAIQASFEVQVTDGLGATATASFNLLIEAIDPYLTQEAIVDGLFSFLMTVEARATNIVQFRDQLGSGDWGTLTNVTSPTRTTVTVSDPATRPSRFYRFYSTNAPGPPR
jgi:hypothetical protein